MKKFLRRTRAVQGFRDCRGNNVIFVPHCALNQNARGPGAAECPAAVTPLITGLMERGIGIVQMPCPELRIFGLDRGDVDVRSELQKDPNRAMCRRIAAVLVEDIQQYRKCGITVVGIIGKNGSPTCGVEETWSHRITPGVGVFVEELSKELRDRGVRTNITGTRDTDPAATLATVDRWLADLQ